MGISALSCSTYYEAILRIVRYMYMHEIYMYRK